MTVAALIRGPTGTFNALGVDSIAHYRAPTASGFAEAEHDKLGLAWGETYVTAVGDAFLLQSLRDIAAWLHPRRPSLKDPRTFDALLAGLEHLRRVSKANGVEPASAPGASSLLVCSREDAYLWMSKFDPASGLFERPSAPKEIAPGHAVVVWGDSDIHVPVPGLTNQHDPFEALADLITQGNAECEQRGYKLPYKLREPFSCVVLPHKQNMPVRRQRPFKSLPEQWAKYSGLSLALLADEAFMSFPMPSTK